MYIRSRSEFAIKKDIPRSSKAQRDSLNRFPNGRRNDDSPTVILFSVIILFLCCHILRFVCLYYFDSLREFGNGCTVIFYKCTTECHETNGTSTKLFHSPKATFPKLLWSLNPVAYFLLLLNSAVNFIIYVFAGTKFRKTFVSKIKQISTFLKQRWPERLEVAQRINKTETKVLTTAGNK